MSDKNSKSFVDNARELRGLDGLERASLLIRENRLKNLDTTEGAGSCEVRSGATSVDGCTVDGPPGDCGSFPSEVTCKGAGADGDLIELSTLVLED